MMLHGLQQLYIKLHQITCATYALHTISCNYICYIKLHTITCVTASQAYICNYIHYTYYK